MNIRRYYNQNRKKIWGILIIMASAFIMFQLLNYMYKVNHEKRVQKVDNNNTTSQLQSNTTIITNNQSVVTGDTLSNEKLEKATSIIDNFISYCNNKELEKAYELLTDECKSQMYTSVSVFEQAYYNDVFGGKSKICTVENWVDDIFKVKIKEDALATGKSNDFTKQDYITVVKVDNGYKLNINNYIGYKKINKTTEKDNISMEVVSKNAYKDYEEYTIKVTNNMDNTILLDSRQDIKTLYLEDSKEVHYSSYSNELTTPMLTVSAGQTKEVTIKFYSSYVSNKKIKYIVFSDLLSYNGQSAEKIEFKANI